VLQAALRFVQAWETKEVNRSTSLEELVDYLGYFREAGGVIPLEVRENENAVRLMTVHGAKGLEFPYVFILRANSNSFPSSYKETLVAFPKELRDPDSVTEEDDKTLHGEEERRLFYVAMTRARDSLQIYAREGKGQTDKTPAGYMRELIKNPDLKRWLRVSSATGAQKPLDLVAASSPTYPDESRVNLWLDLPVLEGLHRRLSASAIDTYERCGLQFQLSRDWRLSAQPAAAMQYGASMHRVLKAYFDSVRAGQPKHDDEVVELFRQDLAAAKIQEACQHELYEKQGIAQLKDFLEAARRAPAAEVLQTEESFDIQFGETVVSGRIDRIDRMADDSVVVVDYKTGRARDQEDADESLQLSLYAIAAKEKWGYEVSALAFHNLEGNVAVTTRRSAADLAETRLRVQKAAEAIARGKFEAKTGMHCNFCGYRSVCPEREKRVSRRAEVGEKGKD